MLPVLGIQITVFSLAVYLVHKQNISVKLSCQWELIKLFRPVPFFLLCIWLTFNILTIHILL